MRFLKILLATLIVAGTAQAYDSGSAVFDRAGDGTELSSDTSPQLGGNLDTNSYCLSDTVGPVDVCDDFSASGDTLHGDDFYPYVLRAATDVAPVVTVISTQGPILQATKPTNSSGGNLVLAPAPGSRNISNVTFDACDAADTITLTPYSNGVAGSACVLTEAAAAGNGTFDCSGAGSDAACITSIRAGFVATAACNNFLSVSSAGSDTLGFGLTAGVSEWLTVSVNNSGGDNCIELAADGTDGSVQVEGTGVLLPTAATIAWGSNGYLANGGTGIIQWVHPNGYGGLARQNLTGYTRGETAIQGTATEVLTFAANPGDASKTTASLIPDGSWLKGITTRVVTAGTNCTTCDIGDGTDVDLFADNMECDVDATTTTNADWTANVANPQLAAGNVTVTANGGNCFDLVIRITATYETFTAPTSD